ncbi:copper chaperone PCu(A)C [Sandaracinobacter neustonicus]|nr:copper chaperone PCu(A)C [Sandaracinobacter neustonicus]
MVRAFALSALLLAGSPALLLAGAPVLAQMAPMAQPHVQDAWVRLPAVSGRPAGGYFLIHGTAKADALTGVSSPKAERIELHSMTNEGGVMKMRAEPSFAVPAKGVLQFAPGGSHLMIFGLAPDVKPGAAIPLTFSFQSGAKVTLNAEARAANAPVKADAPAHQH